MRNSLRHQVNQTSVDALGNTTTYAYDPNSNSVMGKAAQCLA